MAGVYHTMMQASIGTPSFTNLIYAKDTYDVNLRNDIIAAGWDGVTVITVNVTVETGIKIMASSTSTFAMDTGILPAGSVINLVNKGYIIGKGGDGGNTFNSDNSTAGLPGGPAFRAQVPINVTNYGLIGSGGGGGGGGGSGSEANPPGVRTVSGGGGGGGANKGKGGTTVNGYNGVTANELQAGAGGPSAGANSGRGGNGGSFGNPGEPGQNGYQFHVPQTTSGKPGGAAGVAITGAALVTWVTYGNVYGPLDTGFPPTLETVRVDLISNTQNFNLLTYLQSLGYSPTTTAYGIIVTITTGIIVSASSTAAPAFTTGSGWFTGNIIKVTNNGYIIGKGGNGGNAGYGVTGQFSGRPGANGGLALQVSYPIELTNNGRIAGGGGGGGGGAGAIPNFNVESGGSGGGGAGYGQPGAIYAAASLRGVTGSPGTQLIAGIGGRGYQSPFGNAGYGGQLGLPGESGNFNNQGLAPGGPGGAPGAAVAGNSNITWITTGTINGALT